MRFYFFLLLAAPLLSFAQAPPAAPPPQVDQALRARAAAFLQYQIDGNFRKAYDLVAEDSKDDYFSAAKQKAVSFVIDDIQYADDFSKATVKATVKQQMTVAGQKVEIPGVQATRWKLEKGEWMWYHDPSKDVVQTIVGSFPLGAAPPATAGPANSGPIPTDVSQGAAAAAAAAKLVPKATIDKKAVTFTLGKEATEEVTFHNSNPGQVRVYVGVTGDTDSITVEPRDAFLNPQAELPVKITYKPMKETLSRTVIEFTVAPFGSVYVLPVRAVREGAAPNQ